jgi:hypothetical protein
MGAFHGIQVYEILENGNLLNAILTYTADYAINNEIAIKKQYDDKGVEGLYDCRFIETNKTSVIHCDLEIKMHKRVYVFTWKIGSELIWEGVGLMAGTTHISVSYVKP